ncbi:MAG: shikimate dehydrogenase [Thermaerobacter sp.]|nr:shikimate dehydrogenase [Thermaerobacter sp.]
MERFAFVLHPLRFDDFTRKFPLLNSLPESLVEKGFSRLPPFKISHITGARSKTGAEAEGWFVVVPVSAHLMLELPFREVMLPKLLRAGKIAEKLGAGILGLGAFTKVIGDRGISVAKGLDIPVTTGNSYTTASAVDGALLGARRMGISPDDATAVVVGATGAIGRAASAALAGEVRRLVLVGRQTTKLQEVARSMQDLGTRTEVEISTDAKSAAGAADILLTVSSATGVILEPADLRPGAVVCDVARPRNVSEKVYEQRRDVLVIDGGVIEVPGPVDFHFNFGFPPGYAEACIAETMILALERRYEPYTLGLDIRPERVREIRELANKHGFSVAGFRRFERSIPDEEVEEIRRAAKSASRRSSTTA